MGQNEQQEEVSMEYVLGVMLGVLTDPSIPWEALGGMVLARVRGKCVRKEDVVSYVEVVNALWDYAGYFDLDEKKAAMASRLRAYLAARPLPPKPLIEYLHELRAHLRTPPPTAEREEQRWRGQFVVADPWFDKLSDAEKEEMDKLLVAMHAARRSHYDDKTLPEAEYIQRCRDSDVAIIESYLHDAGASVQ